MEEEEEAKDDVDVILPTQPPKKQRKSRRKKKTAAEAAAEIEEAAVEEVDDTLQGDDSWANQVEEEEERMETERQEAASAAATLEVLTAAEEEEDLEAAIAEEVREAAAARAEAEREAALFATSTPTIGRGSAGSVESGTFPLTPEMETAVSRIGADDSSIFSSINDNNNVGASPALPSAHPQAIVTPGAVKPKVAAAAAATAAASSVPLVASHNIMLLPPTAGLALASSSSLPVQGAETAPPTINSSSMSPQLLALISNSVIQTSSNGKVAIPRLNSRNSRSVSVKRQNSDGDYLDPNVSNAAKRNPSANRVPLNPSLTQQELMASVATNQRQQQQRGRTTAKGGQRGGRGGL